MPKHSLKRRTAKAFKKRSAAAKQGWITRRKNERSEAARRRKNLRKRAAPKTAKQPVKKKGRAQALPFKTPPFVEWLVSISYKKRPRGFSADLLMGAEPDATATELADQAREQLRQGLTFLANWVESGWTRISKGKPTNRRFTKVRAFQRWK